MSCGIVNITEFFYENDNMEIIKGSVENDKD
jgi:hypothetical protein